MSVSNSRVRILLLQARYPDDPAGGEEARSFAERTAVAMEQMVPWDLLQGPPTLAQVCRHDALMVGGSGDFYVSKRDLPQHQRTLDLLLDVVERGHPTFASCFGFQCLVQALGGEIVYD
ncbi:MAG: type 1 glutamine amidotransferase, partial [Thermoanaerobaculia bacterium]